MQPFMLHSTHSMIFILKKILVHLTGYNMWYEMPVIVRMWRCAADSRLRRQAVLQWRDTRHWHLHLPVRGIFLQPGRLLV